ncbi:hypothetical protein N7517_001037 [Penicillium concentricum]|uniref:Aldehyde dehydrogenase domain-containing protein n=1 Tax=Penicillium concentricum TaxID=293559 RepID=A0A9W9VKQ9_9EURO|nr:uncharacterized protein N7517_001037 [Penicillium concentricum]KAJ5383126.1 hypothetical protein N7517_001037 [Penicillium concentricum]
MDTISTLWKLDTIGRATGYVTNSENEHLRLQNFIENKFLDRSHTSEWIDSLDPRSGNILLKLPLSPQNVVEYAVNVASRAFKTWSKTSSYKRSDLLLRIANILEEKKEMFSVWESIDQGKLLNRARREVDCAIEIFRYFARYILHDEDTAVHLNRAPEQSTLTYEHRLPVGVYAIITSSNMPFYLLASNIAPCLAFGCTGVAKPSEHSSMTAFLLAEVLLQAELPPGVMNIVFGNGPDTGSTLVGLPLVQGVSFTGGTETGIQIRKDTAVDIHKRLSLDIRASSPTLVFGDVDLDDAVSTAAYAAFENSGQLCLGGSRIYVYRSIYKIFLAKLIRFVVENYQVARDLGPVVSQEHYDKIRSRLVQASEEYVIFEIGEIPKEAPNDGFWVGPTVLSHIHPNSRLVQEEIFGPVAAVYSFDTEAEVVRLCNNNSNGMGAVILTDDLSRMRRVGEHLDAGLTWGSCWLGRELGAGLNDVKAAGTGRGGGARSRDVFTRLQAVHVPSY